MKNQGDPPPHHHYQHHHTYSSHRSSFSTLDEISNIEAFMERYEPSCSLCIHGTCPGKCSATVRRTAVNDEIKESSANVISMISDHKEDGDTTTTDDTISILEKIGEDDWWHIDIDSDYGGETNYYEQEEKVSTDAGVEKLLERGSDSSITSSTTSFSSCVYAPASKKAKITPSSSSVNGPSSFTGSGGAEEEDDYEISLLRSYDSLGFHEGEKAILDLMNSREQSLVLPTGESSILSPVATHYNHDSVDKSISTPTPPNEDKKKAPANKKNTSPALLAMSEYGGAPPPPPSILLLEKHCVADKEGEGTNNKRAIARQDNIRTSLDAPPRPPIHVLTERDVLLGRGIKCNSLPGNQRFRKLVDQKKQLYFDLGSNRDAKNALSIQVMQSVHAYGGRFLEMTSISPLIYSEVDERRARKKCSQRLREGGPKSTRKCPAPLPLTARFPAIVTPAQDYYQVQYYYCNRFS